MLIEHTCQREGGTHVNVLGTSYHFTPDEHGRHVAEVSEPSHIAHFLSIKPGFEPVGAISASAPEPVPIAYAPVYVQTVQPVKRRGRPPKAAA